MALSRSSKAFLVVLLLLGLGAGLGISWLFATADPDPQVAEGEVVEVEIPEGTGASTVADVLEEAGVIRSAFAFRILARFDDRSAQLKPGVYELQVGMSADEILEILADRNRVRLSTSCVNQRGEEVLSGEAWVMPSKRQVVYDERPRAAEASWMLAPWAVAAQVVAFWGTVGLALMGAPRRATSEGRR